MRAAWCALLAAIQLLVPLQPPPDVFAFFRPAVNLTTADRMRLRSGAPLVVVLDAKDRDVSVFSAIELSSVVTPERFAAWLQNIAEFRKSSYVVAVRRFSPTPRPEDVDGLTLDDEDLSDIRNCRPGHCGLKLSSAEIATLRGIADGAGADWRPALQAGFREVILQRVRVYSTRGHAAFGAYCDRKRPRSPAGAFTALLDRTAFLAVHDPEILRHLADDGPAAPANDDSYLYWSKERMGGKTIISATHITIFRGDGNVMPDVLMTGKQIFATHYLDACLGVTALVRDRQSSRSYFVYLNRSEVDLLGGFWGGIARHMIEERVDADGPGLLREIARRLSAGDPPLAAAGSR